MVHGGAHVARSRVQHSFILRNETIVSSTLPMMVEARDSYSTLQDTHGAVQRAYDERKQRGDYYTLSRFAKAIVPRAQNLGVT